MSNETEVLPPVVSPFEEPPRKKRRWLGWVIALVVVAILLAIAWVVGDNVARSWATGYIRDKVSEVLSLEPGTPVDVELGEGSLLAQAITGRIDSVHVAVDGVTFGDLTGDVVLSAEGVPLDTTAAVQGIDVTMRVSEENVQKLAGYLSESELLSIKLINQQIQVGASFQVFGLPVPVSVGLAPSAADGEIVFDPRTIKLGPSEISVDDLRSGPLSGVASPLLASRAVCVAGYLPRDLTVVGVTIVGKELVVRVNGDGVPLEGPGMSTMGTCAG